MLPKSLALLVARDMLLVIYSLQLLFLNESLVPYLQFLAIHLFDAFCLPVYLLVVWFKPLFPSYL